MILRHQAQGYLISIVHQADALAAYMSVRRSVKSKWGNRNHTGVTLPDPTIPNADIPTYQCQRIVDKVPVGRMVPLVVWSRWSYGRPIIANISLTEKRSRLRFEVPMQLGAETRSWSGLSSDQEWRQSQYYEWRG